MKSFEITKSGQKPSPPLPESYGQRPGPRDAGPFCVGQLTLPKASWCPGAAWCAGVMGLGAGHDMGLDWTEGRVLRARQREGGPG